MPKVYRISKIGSKILSKVRHRKGHGIHSPFVFNIVTKVIDEKLPYYAYSDLEAYIEEKNLIKIKNKKNEHLIFRLTNYFNPKNVLEIGSDNGVSTMFALASNSKIRCNCVELNPNKYKKADLMYRSSKKNIILHTEKLPDLKEQQDCIIINLNNYKTNFNLFESYIFPLCHEKSFIVVKGIRTKQQNQMLWRMLKQTRHITVSLDLYSLGIIFVNNKLYKRNYRLNF